MKAHISHWLAAVLSATALCSLPSCVYDPNFPPAATYYGGSSGSLFIATGDPRWGYDPGCHYYYDYRRKAYYDPYRHGYYPIGYRPPLAPGGRHPYGWRPGTQPPPPPRSIRNAPLPGLHGPAPAPGRPVVSPGAPPPGGSIFRSSPPIQYHGPAPGNPGPSFQPGRGPSPRPRPDAMVRQSPPNAGPAGRPPGGGPSAGPSPGRQPGGQGGPSFRGSPGGGQPQPSGPQGGPSRSGRGNRPDRGNNPGQGNPGGPGQQPGGPP